MTDEEDDDVAVAAEYVLGLLEPEEARAFEARMDLDPPVRALVARWTEDLAGLALAVPEVRPPASVEAALMRRLFPEEKRSWLRRLGLLPALMGGLVAAMLVLWASNGGLLRQAPVGPAYEARIAAEDASLVLLARYEPEEGVLTVEREAGGVAAGRAQELWVVIGDAPPRSLGLLPEAGAVSVPVDEALAADLDGALLAVSDEAPGGAASGAAPGTLLATGVITAL